MSVMANTQAAGSELERKSMFKIQLTASVPLFTSCASLLHPEKAHSCLAPPGIGADAAAGKLEGFVFLNRLSVP